MNNVGFTYNISRAMSAGRREFELFDLYFSPLIITHTVIGPKWRHQTQNVVLDRLRPPKGLTSILIVYILSPVTDNCPS